MKHDNSLKQPWKFQCSHFIPLASTFLVLGLVDQTVRGRSFDVPSKPQVQTRQYEHTTVGRNVQVPISPWERPLSSPMNQSELLRNDIGECAVSVSMVDAAREKQTRLDWDEFDHNALQDNSEEADTMDSDFERTPKTMPTAEPTKDTSTKFRDSSSLKTPVVYRYYGRNRARLHSAGSIPFILLGPSVDDWKDAAQLLAARGFSVIACECVGSSNAMDANSESSTNSTASEEGTNVVLSILDALRWSRVVVVGCDRESALAIQAALQLAPQRIAGLVLCGELQDAYRLVSSLQPGLKFDGGFVLDYFLQNFVEAPFIIVWDGESMLSESDAFRGTASGNRCLILGGGSAPHRRRPEQFAWALTRFVEQKVVPTSLASEDSQARRENFTSESTTRKLLSLPFSLEEILSPGTGLLVSGRVIASIIFYFSALKVLLYQYENFRLGLLGVKSKYDTISSFQRRMLLFVRDFFLNYGYLLHIWRYIRPRAKSKDHASSSDNENGQKDELDSDKNDQSSQSGKTETEADEPRKDYQPDFKPSFFLDQVIA